MHHGSEMTSEADLDRTDAPTCPNCGRHRIASMLYGEPREDPELDADIEAGRIVLAGCNVQTDSRAWRCGDCGHDFGSMMEP